MGLPWNVNASMGGAGVNDQIIRSMRTRSSASAYLNRTPASASNRTTWTWSGWVKRGQVGVDQTIFNGWDGSNNATGFFFNSNDTIQIFSIQISPTTYSLQLDTTQVFRDPSAWYHIILAVDTTQATASNRVKLYVNGVQVTAFSTANYPALNSNLFVNTNSGQFIGRRSWTGANYFDGYWAEMNFIDGQQLTPASFGYNDPVTGVWQPAPFKGTYGTNGFYLPFTDIATTSGSNFGLGRDYSGNSNYWNTNNISVTSGTTYDSMIDSPTNFNDGTGIYNRGNYPTLNPLIAGNSSYLINANLSVSGAAAGNFQIPTMQLPTTGKWYCEMSTTAYGASTIAGWFGVSTITGSNFSGLLARTVNAGGGFYQNDVYISNQNINVLGSVIGIAVDRGANTVTIYINNVAQGVVPTLATGVDLYFGYGTYTGCVGWVNFGQQPFTYTPPTGFKALNTYNLPTPTIANGAAYMAASTWTGDGTSPRTFTNGGNNTLASTFQPDLVWIKMRSGAYQHVIADSVRGGNAILHSNSTSAEDVNWQYGYLQSFNSNGFTAQSGSTSIENINLNGSTFVGWQWKAGAGTTSTNTSGSITSTVSANTTAGFSVVTYTGTGANATVGHGLGVAPSMYIIKRRNTTGNWPTFHTSITASNVLYLNVTDAQAAYSNVFNATNPTSTVFSIGTSTDTNASGSTYVAYCFSAIRGYSAFGSYTGNGSTDGPFVYTGFRPRFILLKNASAAGTVWLIFDTSRNTYNVANLTLQPENSAAEVTSGGWDIDILSNGFKPRNSGTSSDNGSGNTIIYAAFAENPFNYSRAR